MRRRAHPVPLLGSGLLVLDRPRSAPGLVAGAALALVLIVAPNRVRRRAHPVPLLGSGLLVLDRPRSAPGLVAGAALALVLIVAPNRVRLRAHPVPLLGSGRRLRRAVVLSIVVVLIVLQHLLDLRPRLALSRVVGAAGLAAPALELPPAPVGVPQLRGRAPPAATAARRDGVRRRTRRGRVKAGRRRGTGDGRRRGTGDGRRNWSRLGLGLGRRLGLGSWRLGFGSWRWLGFGNWSRLGLGSRLGLRLGSRLEGRGQDVFVFGIGVLRRRLLAARE